MIVFVLAAALLGGVLIVMNIGGERPRGITGRAYYYDPNTGDLFVVDAAVVPPIAAPSGPLRGADDQKAGVRAYVFTCGGDNETDRYVAWIETYPPGARNASPAGEGYSSHRLMGQADGRSPMVARINPGAPSDVRWFGADSAQGIEIVRNNASTCADGSAPVPCVPE